MSEQEMDLDTAIELFRLVWDYEEYVKGLREVLTRVHTQEELDKARKAIDEEKERLMNTNAEFKEIMDRRKQEAKQMGDYNRALHRAKMSEAKSEAMMKAESSRRDADRMRSGVDDWVARTKIKTRTYDEAKEQSEQKLICPICQGLDRGNVMNDTPFCFDCNHKLVPESELKDYPRKYRRAWKRKKKRK